MSYQVVAPLVIAQDAGGSSHHVYQGGIIPWLSDEQAAHFLSEKLVVDLGADDSDEEDGGKPAHTAKKDVLVDWIVANVAKSEGVDYTEDELNELTKAQLQEIIDSVE